MIRNMKKYISLFIVLGLGMGACLDEDPLFDPSKVKNVIEFYDLQNPASPTDAPHHLYVNSYAISAAEVHTLQLSYSGAHSNGSDIEVELAVSPQALAEYNEYLVDQGVGAGDTLADGTPDMANILQYELMPPTFYTIDNMTVTIPSGETKVNVEVTVNTTMFDFAKAYVLPLRIVGASSGVISGNYGVALFNIGAKNSFHGLYHSTGIRYNFDAAGDWNGAFPVTGAASTGPWDFPAVSVLTVNEFTSTIHAANSDGGFGTINITVVPGTPVTDNDALPLPGASVLVNVAPNASTALNALTPMQASAGKTSLYNDGAKTFKLYYQYTNTTGTFRTMWHYATRNP
jgi:hypothetical protein